MPGASNVSVIVPVEISCCTARRWRAAAAWCRAMISRTVSVCRASTRTPSAKCPSADGTRDDGLAARQRHSYRARRPPARSSPERTRRARSRPSPGSVHRGRSRAAARRSARRPCRPGPVRRARAARLRARSRMRPRAPNDVGRQRDNPSGGVRLAGSRRRPSAPRPPAKTLAGNGGETGRSASTLWKSTYEPISRSTSACQSPVVVIMPTRACGAALRISTSCVFRRNRRLVRRSRSARAPRERRPDAAAAGPDSGAGAPACGRTRPGRPPASAMACSGCRHGGGTGAAALDEDLDAVQGLGNQQRLSRGQRRGRYRQHRVRGRRPAPPQRPGSEDPGPTELEWSTFRCGPGVFRPRAQGRTTPPRSPATVNSTLQRAYNERLVMNSLPSQGADPKGLV